MVFFYNIDKSCKVYANSNTITNNRTSFSLEHISCENGFSEKLTGYILGEDAKREILLEKNNIDKELILGVFNGFLQLMNLNKENLNNEILENLYIISPNRKFDLIISEEILGQCGGDYKFKDGKCIIELIEDIQK